MDQGTAAYRKTRKKHGGKESKWERKTKNFVKKIQTNVTAKILGDFKHLLRNNEKKCTVLFIEIILAEIAGVRKLS